MVGRREAQDTVPIFQFCMGLALDRGTSLVLSAVYHTETPHASALVNPMVTTRATSYFAQLQRAPATHLVVIKDLFGFDDNISLSSNTMS